MLIQPDVDVYCTTLAEKLGVSGRVDVPYVLHDHVASSLSPVEWGREHSLQGTPRYSERSGDVSLLRYWELSSLNYLVWEILSFPNQLLVCYNILAITTSPSQLSYDAPLVPSLLVQHKTGHPLLSHKFGHREITNSRKILVRVLKNHNGTCILV